MTCRIAVIAPCGKLYAAEPRPDRSRQPAPLSPAVLASPPHSWTSWRLYMRRSFVPVLLLAAACQAAPSDPAAVRQAIEANNARAERWYAAGQADSLATLFAEDVWQLPPNSPPVTGRDSLRQYWAAAFKAGSWDFKVATQDVVTSGPVAVERGRYSVRFSAGPGAPMPSFADSGNYVVYWREGPDKVWRAVWDAPVSVVPLSLPPTR